MHTACDQGKINFLVLLKKPEVYSNFSSYALLLINNYLNYRSQTVFFNGKWTCFKEEVSGVSQGSIIGPLLFLLFINDLPLSLDSKCHIFADDVQIYRSCKVSETTECVLKLNSDVKLVLKWSLQNGILLNLRL